MNLLVLQAFWQLLRFDFLVTRNDFRSLYTKVGDSDIRKPQKHFYAVPEICTAMDLTCIWYPKQVLCLQRSAATACLLKRFGHPAQLVVGTVFVPFKAHAWVEVDGRVVNDRASTIATYAVLDRC